MNASSPQAQAYEEAVLRYFNRFLLEETLISGEQYRAMQRKIQSRK